MTVFPTNFNPGLALLDAASTQGSNLMVLTLANIADNNGAETAQWFNASGNAIEVIIAVDSISTSTAGTFSLSLTLVDAPPGEAPLTAETLASTGTNSSTKVGYLNNLALPSSCTGFATPRADRFFPNPGTVRHQVDRQRRSDLKLGSGDLLDPGQPGGQ